MRSLLLVFVFISLPLHAEDAAKLYSMLDTKLLTPALKQEAIVQGQERATVCKYCHGTDGNSKRDHIPNLAEQNPKYLLKQFELFATKQRPNIIMSELAKNLTSKDRVNISLFYASQKAKPAPALSPEDAAKGSKIFRTHCATCHGDSGHGHEELPRIASQPTEYLNRTLDSYRNDPSFRPNSPMQGIVSTLNEAQQASVTAYISTLK